MPLRWCWLRWSPRFLAAPGSGVRFPGRSIWRVAWRPWRPLLRLPVDHCAGEGAGDAVHGLDAGGYQPAQLIQTGGLDPGDDVVGTSDVFGHLHTIEIAERLGDMGDLADLGLDEHVRAQHPRCPPR